jgi:thioredoxin-related protein
MKRLLLFILIIVSLFISACSTQTTAPAPTPTSTIDASAEMQAKRYDFIQDLIAQGILLKVEKPSTLPHAWVTPLFYSLNFDDKQSFISVVWTYYFVKDSKATTVILYDSKTGKQIGTFNEYKGLELD